ncbi:hypothetical protein EDC01DRAFT_196984 [Geopyxis carbonaria]|nr:hypothetical protein EDC01DRAFT_196984 [Geopyxis carbonaria]
MAALQESDSAVRSTEQDLRQLEIEFTTLDSALITPIYYDTLSLEQARETLRILQAETTVDDLNDLIPEASLANSCPEWGDWNSETDPTTLSISSLRISDNDQDEGEGVGKVAELAAMFPMFGRFTLKNILEKCGDSVERATDELLNRTYIDEEEGGLVKGIDGFEDNFSRHHDRRKKKPKKGDLNVSRPRHHRSSSVPSHGNLNAKENTSMWDKMNQEIIFISNSLGISKSVVSSAYHSNGGSLPATVVSLLQTHGQHESGNVESAEHYAQLSKLLEEFGKDVNPKYLDQLVRLCRDKEANIFIFADILRQYKPPGADFKNIELKNTSGGSMTASGRVAHSRHGQGIDEDWTVVGTSLGSPPSTYTQTHINYAAASSMAGTYKNARNEAFQKAADSYRRSKSDRYMGGAAAFYSDLGRGYDMKTKEYDNLAAEQLVTENSDENRLDLHGVTVPQGIKIARERTTQWWVRSRPAENGRGIKPFVIVTGLGRHSKGGNSKLCPAVSKMLQRENWNVRVEEGQIVVFSAKR